MGGLLASLVVHHPFEEPASAFAHVLFTVLRLFRHSHLHMEASHFYLLASKCSML